MKEIFIALTSLLIGGTLGYILNLRKEFIINYQIPFINWSINLYGDLYEFEVRYFKHNDKNFISPTLIIIDFRDLHDKFIDSTKWYSKIKKDNYELAYFLIEFMNKIDNYWHFLQDKYNFNFQTGDWIQEIIKNNNKEKISKDIINFIDNNLKDLFEDKNYKKLKDYLYKQTPRRIFFEIF